MIEDTPREESPLPLSIEALTEVGTFSHEGRNLTVFKEQLPDGRMHLYFAATREELAAADRRGREVIRIGYRVYEHEVMLLGFVVPESEAGHHTAQVLIAYFLEYVKKEGLEFIGTAKINKPLIAQALVRAGFEPESRNVLVEILPRRTTDTSHVPHVQVVDNRQSAKLITGATGGAFYRLVPPEEVLRKYPISGPDSVVAIQTRYLQKKEK